MNREAGVAVGIVSALEPSVRDSYRLASLQAKKSKLARDREVSRMLCGRYVSSVDFAALVGQRCLSPESESDM